MGGTTAGRGKSADPQFTRLRGVVQPADRKHEPDRKRVSIGRHLIVSGVNHFSTPLEDGQGLRHPFDQIDVVPAVGLGQLLIPE